MQNLYLVILSICHLSLSRFHYLLIFKSFFYSALLFPASTLVDLLFNGPYVVINFHKSQYSYSFHWILPWYRILDKFRLSNIHLKESLRGIIEARYETVVVIQDTGREKARQCYTRGMSLSQFLLLSREVVPIEQNVIETEQIYQVLLVQMAMGLYAPKMSTLDTCSTGCSRLASLHCIFEQGQVHPEHSGDTISRSCYHTSSVASKGFWDTSLLPCNYFFEREYANGVGVVWEQL